MSTTLIRRRKRGGNVASFRIANLLNVAIGDYIALDAAGDAREIADTGGFQPLGFAVGFSDRDTANGTDVGATGDTPPPEVGVDISGGIVEGLTVVGAAGNDTDKGRHVYVTAGDTFTLTPTANIPAVGEIVRSASTTDIDVYFYARDAMGSVGGSSAVRSLLLGVVHTTALEGVADAVIAVGRAPGGGTIRRIRVKPTGFDAGYVAGSQTFAVSVGATAIGFSAALLLNDTDIDALADLATVPISVLTTGDQSFSNGQSIFLRMATDGQGFTAAIDTVSLEFWLDYEERGL